ncbi:hypothetical protein H8B06_05090 [Sphingobacterium sp. DN00404]|uniref:GH16 domain-containing protein n=1 Tax=Sphingobacterium micropteri TaxID=2763501 RepID=A0ABR7YLZ6_9SPHI|nr:hypothetical protein [Sphingobacterium micropteri]MBD1432193.1 hypothetical protein [Sphingobacterium micropteri]
MRKHFILITYVMLMLFAYSCRQSTEDEWEALKLPQITLIDITEHPEIGVIVKGRVVGDKSIHGYGVCWGNHPNLTLLDNKMLETSHLDDGEFEFVLTTLNDHTHYYISVFAQNEEGTAFSDAHRILTLSAPGIPPVVFLDSMTFDSPESFDAHWNMYYPWGIEHNGSARMYDSQVELLEEGVLRIKADVIDWWEGTSGHDPWLTIRYHAGAIHYKQHITVTDEFPEWEISGDFQVPTVIGTWPAFWITGVENWPPESDIMEFKGDNINWQNTVTGPNWTATYWQNELRAVANAGGWHNYKVIIRKVSDTDTELDYYIDNVKTATHYADFVDKPFFG